MLNWRYPIIDDGEVFRVKKSSQSRRLMKQKKLDKKRKELGFVNEEFEEGKRHVAKKQLTDGSIYNKWNGLIFVQ